MVIPEWNLRDTVARERSEISVLLPRQRVPEEVVTRIALKCALRCNRKNAPGRITNRKNAQMRDVAFKFSHSG